MWNNSSAGHGKRSERNCDSWSGQSDVKPGERCPFTGCSYTCQKQLSVAELWKWELTVSGSKISCECLLTVLFPKEQFVYDTIPELWRAVSGRIVTTCSLARRAPCSSYFIPFDRCRNEVISQALLDNARIKGVGAEQSSESIGLFHSLFTSSQADCSCAFQKCTCAVRLMPCYHNDKLRKSGYSSEVTSVFGQKVLNSALL